MNENVRCGLENYLRDVDPQYAVLLTGKWGCGKTYFVKNWIEDIKNNQDEYSITPLYISLFGVSTILALIEKVNKALSPLMYEVEKSSKELLRIAAKVVLKYDNTIADMNDAKLAYEISPIDLLSIMNDENSKVTAKYKLFVFDDIERCKIAPEELMGFFDLCLEQLGCRLVVVKGSNSTQSEEWVQVMSAYQEKIFSREYEIESDIQSAISHFVDELSVTHPVSYEFLQRHADAVRKVYECSTYKNLRTLRHSIRSFAEVFEDLTSGVEDVELSFMLQYLAVSLEYLNENKAVLLSMGGLSQLLGFGHDETPESKMMKKYLEIQHVYRTSVFVSDILGHIKDSVVKGADISTVLNDRISNALNKSLSERLRNIWNLDNNSANSLIREAKEYLKKPVENISEYLFAVYMLCYLEDCKVTVLKKRFEDDACAKIITWIKNVMTPVNFTQIEMAIANGCAIRNTEKQLDRFTKLYDGLQNFLGEVCAKNKEPIVNALEMLTDESMVEVSKIMADTDPKHREMYKNQAVFHKVNVQKRCNSIRKLSNYNKRLWADILAARYRRGLDKTEYVSRFGEEKESLDLMLAYFQKEENRVLGMSKLAVGTIVKELKFAVGYFVVEN